MSRISVIVPVYKAELFLEKCVRSILNQSFQDLELILVDDGSPDNSSVLCDKFAMEDNRVRVIHQKNAGVAAARNAGLEIARGEYITFVDSDDYIDVQMYNQMMNVADEYNCDVVMCDCVKEFENHTELYTHDIRAGFYDRRQLETEYFSNLLIMPNVEYPPTISNCLCLFRYNFKNDGNYLRYEMGIRYSEDLLFGAKLMYHAQSFYYMKGAALYHYNCTNQFSATHTFVPDKWKDYQKLHWCIQKDFGKCKIFDFREQIDKVLLFFVYNAVGDIWNTKSMDLKQRKKMAANILSDTSVREMFERIHIWKLPISFKLKLITLCYAHPFFWGIIAWYLSDVRRKR